MSTPTQQRALFLTARKSAFAINARPIPKPGAGEILIKNVVIGLNSVEWKIQEEDFFVDSYPAVLGLEASGTVEAIGEGVSTFKKGDRVWYAGMFKNDRATYQEYTLIDAGLAGKLPENLTFDEGATIPLAITTASIALYNWPKGPRFVAPWLEGGRGKYAGIPLVVLGGSSIMGSAAIQLARLSGFSPIITTASLKNAEVLKSYGASHVLDRNLSPAALAAEVTKIAGGQVSIVFDAISVPETQHAGYGLLAPNGTMLTLLHEEIKETTEGRAVVYISGLIQTPANVEFGKKLFEGLPGLLASSDFKPFKAEVVPGGLGGIVAGLEKSKANQVSAVKLVVRPAETA